MKKTERVSRSQRAGFVGIHHVVRHGGNSGGGSGDWPECGERKNRRHEPSIIGGVGRALAALSCGGLCMRQLVTRFVTTLSLVAVLAAISATPALAQDAGLRGGVSIDPDQFYFGGHIETSPLVDRLHFRPNVEVGIGEDLMLIGANMEFVYKFPQRGGWGFYAGAGPALDRKSVV